MQVRYADGERVCQVFINEGADEAIHKANAERFVARIDTNSALFQELQSGLEELWKEVVGDEEEEDLEPGTWDGEEGTEMVCPTSDVLQINPIRIRRYAPESRL